MGRDVVGRWDLPSGWQWLRARDFSKVIGGGTPKNAKDPTNYSNDGMPWITPADLSGYRQATISRGARSLSDYGFKRSSAKPMPAGTVLISSRAPVGYCVVASCQVTTNQGFRSLVLSDQVDPFFVRYYILSSKAYLEENASGTTFKELPGKVLGGLLFPIPPLSTQRRVVARIDELLSEVESGQAILNKVGMEGSYAGLIGDLQQSVLNAAFKGKLVQ